MAKMKLYLVALVLSSYSLFAQTWSPPIRVSPNVSGYYIILGQGIAVDNSGAPWCGWAAETGNPPALKIYVSQYADTVWSDPDTICPFLAFWNCNLATDANGYIWVVAEDYDISACFYNGGWWSNLMAVPTQGSCSHFPVATGDSVGDFWVCWAGGGPGDGHHIWGNAYIEGAWGSPILISYPEASEEFAYSMTTDRQGKVWVGWRRFGCPDPGICVSFNDGSGWSDTMVIATYSSYGPALTVDTAGRIWAGWIGVDSSGPYKVYASYFGDSVWSEPMLVSESAAWCDWPVAITSDHAGMVWLTWMNPDEDIYYSCWNGGSWSNPAPIDTHPVRDYDLRMTFDGERIWVTWIRWAYLGEPRSVYASYTYGVGVEEKPAANHSPSVLGISQNYPNPFNSNTSISYQLKSNGHVSIRIYDTAGNLVRALVSKHQKAGSYRVIWDGTDNLGHRLPAGVYFIRLKISEKSVTKKIIKLK